MQAARDLAWSLWAELGVSAWDGRHGNFAVDPESLIILTAFLRDRDPRLRDEATDWSIRFARYVSVARLRNLLRWMKQDDQDCFGEFAATVNAHSNARWPHASSPRPYTPTDRSRAEDFESPSRIVLRLRALFGVGARAEVIRVLLAERDGVTAAEVAADVHFTKRNVADELDGLHMGGLLDRRTVRNQYVYRLAQGRNLRQFVGEVPSLFPRWPEVVRICLDLMPLVERLQSMDERVQLVEVDTFARTHHEDLARASLPQPPRAGRDAAAETFQQWAVQTLEGLASAQLPR